MKFQSSYETTKFQWNYKVQKKYEAWTILQNFLDSTKFAKNYKVHVKLQTNFWEKSGEEEEKIHVCRSLNDKVDIELERSSRSKIHVCRTLNYKDYIKLQSLHKTTKSAITSKFLTKVRRRRRRRRKYSCL